MGEKKPPTPGELRQDKSKEAPPAEDRHPPQQGETAPAQQDEVQPTQVTPQGEAHMKPKEDPQVGPLPGTPVEANTNTDPNKG